MKKGKDYVSSALDNETQSTKVLRAEVIVIPSKEYKINYPEI